MDQPSSAYSNPMYGEIEQEDSYRPIPKPRLSKAKKSDVPVIRIDDDEPISSHCDKRSSSVDLGDIRMTQLLEEIDSLTDSLQKSFALSTSEPIRVDQKKDEIDYGENQSEFQHRTLNRKRLPVPSDLLQMSFEEQQQKQHRDAVSNENQISDDSGVFLAMTPTKSKSEPPPSPSEKEEKPPKLPPRKPLRLDLVPKMEPIKGFEETLTIEHLHTDTLSLQRSGYLWKTGPNYRSFKNRWCVLYRHSQNYIDANISYYFNRSSMSASLSGKILLADIEFIAICETVPAKTRLPKIDANLKITDYNNIPNNSNSNKPITDRTPATTTGSSNQTMCFFEIGVKCRQGRVYLFAARSEIDRNQWIHAFVQAITLHAFKKKEIYHCGFIRAKFTITARWQTCFALLTTDRFLYVFEMATNNNSNNNNNNNNNESPPTTRSVALDCQRYHIYNLRKTCRLSRMDETTTITTVANSTTVVSEISGVSGKQDGSPERSGNEFAEPQKQQQQHQCCKSGFSLTLNGGHVVYLSSPFESHINLWYRSVWKFWQTPRQPSEKLILEEQYLTGENLPVAFDKCIKFLDTFNQAGLNLFEPSGQDSIHENSTPPVMPVPRNPLPRVPGSQKHTNPRHQHHPQLTGTTSAPPTSSSPEMDLWTQHQLLTQLRFDSWNVHLLPQKYNATQISQLLLHYLRSMNECIFTETLLPFWAKISGLDPTQMPPSPPSTTADTSDRKIQEPNSLKTEQIKRLLRLMPPVNYATLRRLIIYLANTGHMEESALSSTLCKTLFYSKRSKTPPISNAMARSLLATILKDHVWLFDISKEELEKELQIKRVVNLIINQNRKENAKKQNPHRLKMFRSLTSEHLFANHQKHHRHHHQGHLDPQRVINSLIIGIKVTVSEDNQQSTVNVLINQSTTASDVFDMVMEKVKLQEESRCITTGGGERHYSVFEVICNRRLERIIFGRERILPLVLCWSNWPSHWSMEACIEVKPTEQLLRGPERKGVRLPNMNAIRFESESLNQTSSTMLASVVRYCSPTESRLVKHILAEFSSSQLFFYCKETHHLLSQYSLDDIYWYVGVESSSMFNLPPVKCIDLIDDDDDNNTTNVVTTTTTTSSSSVKRTMASGPAHQNHILHHQRSQPMPGLTFVERIKMKSPNSVRPILPNQCHRQRNFGHTMLFGGYTELDQWIKGLLEAEFYKELYSNSS